MPATMGSAEMSEMESRLSRISHDSEGNTCRLDPCQVLLLQRCEWRFLGLADSSRGSQGGVCQEEKLELVLERLGTTKEQ